MLKIHNFEALHDKKYSVASMLFHYLNAPLTMKHSVGNCSS